MRLRAALPWILVVAFAVAYGLLDVRNRARVDRGPGRHRTDFTVYQAAARALRDGTDPYEARNPRGYRYVYPPPLAILLLPVATWSPPDAALVFFAVSFLALVLLIRAVARLPGVGARGAALATVVCLPFLHQALERGQLTVLLLASPVAALVLLLRRREALAGLALGLGAALRLSPLVPAAAAVLGALAAARARGPGPVLRLGGGVLAGLILLLVVLPAVVLGPERARAVTARWIESTRSVYVAAPGDLADLRTEYGVNEYRFKNQSARRVLSTWAGWAAGSPFEDERPALSPELAQAVDGAAIAVAGAAGLLALLLGWRRLRDPAAPGFAVAFAATVLLPVLLERYAWPNHFAAAFPALALAVRRGGPDRKGVVAFAIFAEATALLYLAHWPPLETIGAAGPLLLGTGLFLALLLARAEGART